MTFCLLLVAEVVLIKTVGGARARPYLVGLSIFIVGVAGVWSVMASTRGFLFAHLLFVDNQAVFIQIVVALCAIFVLLYEGFVIQISELPETGIGIRRTNLPVEWYSLLVAMTLGLFLMAISVNLLSIYLSIELVSIASYLLTALNADRKASEGGIKYLLFGAVSSAVMLYGMSLLYGMTGTLDLTVDVFGNELARQDAAVVSVALLLTLAGLFFKLAGVPFHVWTPDAYEAAPVPVAAFFSVGPKAAAILVLMRLVTVLPVEAPPGGATVTALQTPLAVLALAGMFIGNLSALRQTDAKRLLAYSTIAHAGFLLVGVVSLNEAGFTAALFYVGTYLFMSLAAFFLIDLLAHSNNSDLTIPHLAGLGAKQPLLSAALVVVMLGLTGLPPTVGFTAKLLSFSALYEAYQQTGNPWLLALFALGLLNAIISLAYYLKIPFYLFFRPIPPESVAQPTVLLPKVAVAIVIGLTIAIVALFLKPEWVLRLLSAYESGAGYDPR